VIETSQNHTILVATNESLDMLGGMGNEQREAVMGKGLTKRTLEVRREGMGRTSVNGRKDPGVLTSDRMLSDGFLTSVSDTLGLIRPPGTL